jgi:UPF0176 protein
MIFQVATFYQFTPLKDLETLRETLLNQAQAKNIKGTILIAQEGINATLSGNNAAILDYLDILQLLPDFRPLKPHFSTTSVKPFSKLKVKIKTEIVKMGLPDLDVHQYAGEHVTPQQWNLLLKDPETLVIDTRNDFECTMGTFQNAVNPNTTVFQDLQHYVEHALDPKKHRKIAMCCTGGVRCEKSTAYLKQKGFESVYQLEGGILNYLSTIPESESLWTGRCFVFDDRTLLDHGLNAVGTPEDRVLCGRE